MAYKIIKEFALYIARENTCIANELASTKSPRLWGQ